MATDSDNSVSLPAPPPPRPAARRAAIETAMRKFDGASGDVPERPRRTGWAISHQRQLGALATVGLIAIVSIPAALIALRDHPQVVPSPTPNPMLVQPEQPEAACIGTNCAKQGAAASSTHTAPNDKESVAEVAPPSTSSGVSAPVQLERRSEPAWLEAGQKSPSETPAAPAAAAPPPPPPPSPPPPPAPVTSELYAGEAATQDMVVTGSRIRSPNLSSKSAAETASPLRVIDPYGEFVSGLQADLRDDNRRAVIGRIGLPLRVHQDGRRRVYRSARAIERDFDQIFTPGVVSAILDQPAGTWTTRDGGQLAGNGRVWFGRTCPNKACSPPGPIRIRDVTP